MPFRFGVILRMSIIGIDRYTMPMSELIVRPDNAAASSGCEGKMAIYDVCHKLQFGPVGSVQSSELCDEIPDLILDGIEPLAKRSCVRCVRS
jgi:hypothetical protein